MPNFLIDEDTGLLAAEFVLATLDSAERANAHSLLKTDHGIIAMDLGPDEQVWAIVASGTLAVDLLQTGA